MTLEQLLSGIRPLAPIPVALAASEIAGLDYDSRRVESGFVFFAFPGAKVDGRRFAASALERGALAVVSELPMTAPPMLGEAGMSLPPPQFHSV